MDVSLISALERLRSSPAAAKRWPVRRAPRGLPSPRAANAKQEPHMHKRVHRVTTRGTYTASAYIYIYTCLCTYIIHTYVICACIFRESQRERQHKQGSTRGLMIGVCKCWGAGGGGLCLNPRQTLNVSNTSFLCRLQWNDLSCDDLALLLRRMQGSDSLPETRSLGLCRL